MGIYNRECKKKISKIEQMAILLYQNGLTEEFKSKSYTFSDEELHEIFSDYEKIRSFRLYEVPNSWCIWGQRDPVNKIVDEFNQLASSVIEEECFSPLLIIHDTEVDPSWNLTDSIIINDYSLFKRDILQFLDGIAREIIDDRERAKKESGESNNLIVLEESGVSIDKRIIFKFNIDSQDPVFFEDSNFSEFAKKVHHFLKFSYKNGDIFAVYADKNIIIVLDDNQVDPFIEKIISHFQKKENYEVCSLIRNTYQKWKDYKSKKKSPAKRRSKNKKSDGDPGDGK
jgi:hypothetical protein